jgi:rSAM/selenodomain-associated transferase 1
VKEKKLLLIFVKNPQRGKVKTRLAKTVGDEKAFKTYLRLLDFTIDVAGRVNAKKQIWYSSFIDEQDGLGGDGFEKKLQIGDNLGKRMSNAFYRGFEEYFEKIVIIGSDCPGITAKIIEKAFVNLDHDDVVIGPSEDGGYYLLGLNRLIPEIFKDITWSTDRVFSETVNALKKQSLSYSELPILNDIDTEEDLRNSDLE